MQQDINKQLAETERLIERLGHQAEQEAAMVAVLPVRFSENITAFEKYLPNVAAQFKNYKPTRPFRFFCSENGIPNLLWLDTNVAQYGEDPYAECLQQIESVLNSHTMTRLAFRREENVLNQIHVEYLNKLVDVNIEAENTLQKKQSAIDSVPLSLMFGVGLGYQLGYLLERCDIANLFIFEPDLDVFYASLYAFDWAPFLDFISSENKGFHIFLGQDEETVMLDLSMAIGNRGAFLISTVLSFWHYPSEDIFKLIDRVISEFHLLNKGWGFFDDNLFALAHSAENISLGIPFLLKNKKIDKKWTDIPVFIIGNGPSLDAVLPLIKQYQKNALLVSCGSSISALHRAGIRPDIYVSIERGKAMADFLSLIDDSDYLSKILFLSTDVAHPDHKKYFNKIGLGFKFNEPMYTLLISGFPGLAEQLEPLQSTNPLVGNIGVSMPITLGFKNIYLFGIDNGYRDENHCHSKFSAYYDDDGKQIDILARSSAGSMVAEGNFGGEVVTNALFSMSAHVIGNMLENSPQVTCFNCSDGMKIRGAQPLHLDNLLISYSEINKNELIENIHGELYSPLNTTKEQINEKLNVAFFNELIDRIVEEWDVPVHSKIDMTLRMQRQYEYLKIIAGTRQHHIHRMLIGTLNYVFSMVSVLAYRFENEEETMVFVKKAIEIVQSYLMKAKELYPNALSFVDECKPEILNSFRKNNS
nr:6-hydroxymethylpterin diphosphokinase MptE-like protein [uncultured Tolumonas sp.]